MLRIWRIVVPGLLAAVLCLGTPVPARAADPVRLVLDGKTVGTEPAPRVVDGRTLVPLRAVSEMLGADVLWHPSDRRVEIQAGDAPADLWADRHLVSLERGSGRTAVADVPPRIFEGRTFVPLRLVSQLLGVDVQWRASDRTVLLDTTVDPGIQPFFGVTIGGGQAGDRIEGTRDLSLAGTRGYPRGSQVRFLLLDPVTLEGRIAAQGSDPSRAIPLVPEASERGERVLAGLLLDASGRLVAGTAVPVTLDPAPRVRLGGLAAQTVVTGSVDLSVSTNFRAHGVRYTFLREEDARRTETGLLDPGGGYTWACGLEEAGTYRVQAVVIDGEGNEWFSEPVYAEARPEPVLSLAGVSAGSTLSRPVTLSTRRNFQVSRTEYVMRDVSSGAETVLASLGYGNHRWFPPAGQTGSVELFVRVHDTRERPLESGRIRVQLSGQPLLLLQGIGPGAVVSASTEVRVEGNAPVSQVRYTLEHPASGTRLVRDGSAGSGNPYPIVPSQLREGAWTIRAEARLGGRTVRSEQIGFTVFRGTTYGARPIIEKDRFLAFASELALASQEQTGMSAALQTAQAILETGWGQYVPVDKYQGTFSRNLFGIKGTGPAGSVISNTWEEYNGTTYRVDARFRAYHTVQQSWDDHKRILLTLARYEPYREVMHDPVAGAYALRRAGYATDSQYPAKLIRIIEQYSLRDLDRVSI